MAGARLEKVGTIFARTTALLKKNILVDEKPIWYEIYALHPPTDEPRYDRVPSNFQLREILYEEDVIRANFHSKVHRHGIVNLKNHAFETQTQNFIKLYNNLKRQGALDDEKIFEVALDQLHSTPQVQQENKLTLAHTIDLSKQKFTPSLGLSENFAKALNEKKSDAEPTAENDERKKSKNPTINIKSLF